MITPIQYTLFFFLFAMVCHTQPVEAGPGVGRFTSNARTVNAIRTNARQIFKPTFTIRSRFSGTMNAISVSGDNQWLATGSGNEAAHLWNLTTGQRELELRGEAGAVLTVAFVPGEMTYGYLAKAATKQAQMRKGFLVTGSTNGEVRLWSLITGETVRRFQGHTKAVNALAVTPDGIHLLTGCEDKSIKIWKLEDGSLVRTIQSNNDPIKTLTLSPDGQKLATGGLDGAVRIWNVGNGSIIKEFKETEGPILALAWSPNGNLLASGYENGTVRVKSISQGKNDVVLTGHKGAVRGIAFRSDAALDTTFIATVGADQLVHLWSLPDGKPLKELEGHQKEINTVAFADNGRILLTGSNDQTVRFWQIDSGMEIARLVSMRSGWAVVAPDGRFDGTLDGEMEDRLDAIQWAGDGHAFSVDGFLEKYYHPALLG
ncbi:MAG: WD40 repeat domain-containing protein, partial [Magnetococcales bacterium]|nr:WD40 repeat domain-containing protein [Magnetococcales bacterium]